MVVALLLSTQCNAGNLNSTSKSSAYIKLNKSSLKLNIGDYYNLKATVYGKSKTVVWKSSNSSVVKVNSNGKVLAKGSGTATITAKANGKSVSCKVTVIKASINLNKTSLNLNVGKTYQLKATVKGKSKSVTWSTNNASVVTVSNTGKVIAKKVGTAIITAKANGKTVKCKIAVKRITDVSKVLKLSFNQAKKLLGMNKRIPSAPDSPNQKLFSITGKGSNSYITNVCLPEYENKPGVFSIYLKDKSYSCSGAKIGMSKQEINKKLVLGGWINYSGSSYNFYGKRNSNWSILILYKNGKAYYMQIQQCS